MCALCAYWSTLVALALSVAHDLEAAVIFGGVLLAGGLALLAGIGILVAAIFLALFVGVLSLALAGSLVGIVLAVVLSPVLLPLWLLYLIVRPKRPAAGAATGPATMAGGA